MSRGRHRFLRWLIALALGLGVVIALLLAVLWLDHRRATSLPALTGPFAVGRTTLAWEDPAQTDSFAPAPGIPRRLIAWLWYPAAFGDDGESDYLPAPWRAALEGQRGVLISNFLTRDLAKVRVHSLAAGSLAPEPRRIPILILRPGLAALSLQYSALAEDLASHGYIVVAFDAPYRTAVVVLADGQVIARTTQNNVESAAPELFDDAVTRLQSGWIADITFALAKLQELDESSASHFHDRLDLENVGIVGHSLGGATAAQFCHEDPRCKAGIDIDGALRGAVVHDGLPRPFLFLLGAHDDPDAPRVAADFRSAVTANRASAQVISIRGANHFGFSDDGALLKSPVLRSALGATGIVDLDGARQLALTSRIVHSFFDVHLKGAPRSIWTEAISEPELQTPQWAR